MAYNPYNDILEIYRAGNDWQNEQDENKRKTIQQNAQTYYNKLRDNGYGSVADELQVSDSIKRKQILDRYSAPVTPQETINASQTIPNPGSAGTTNTDNSAKTLINNGNNSIFEKYEREYTDLKDTNPFETEVGKSILAKYDLAGLQARDNEVASEAGSNDGNIDSFAATNALRQQTALVTKGQEVALDAHQQKLDHARALLSDMGVHIDRVFTQDETAKNNDVARKSEIASVTGYVPDEWVISNNPYMNEDGTIKDEYKNVDFAAVMANAKAAGNTEAYNAAAQARYYKIMGNYGVYGKWDNGDYIVPGQQKTEVARQFDKQIDSAERIAKGENDTNLALADKQIAASETGGDDYAAYDTLLKMWPTTETEKRVFIESFIKPIYEGKEVITPEGIKNLIIANSAKYNIDVDDAQKICQAFDVSTEWLKDYRDRTNDDGKVTDYSGQERDGVFGGMVKK